MAPMPRSLLALALVASLLFASRAGAASPFTFKIPPGWVDLSPGAPAANFERAPAGMAAEAKSGRYTMYAADLEHAGDGFVENVNAIAGDGTLAITPADVTRHAEGLVAGIPSKGGVAAVIEQSVATFGGVHVSRVVADIDVGNVQTRMLQYLIPGETSHVVLTYSAARDAFASYVPAFEAAAAATGGMHEPKTSFDWWEMIQSGIIGGAVAGSGVLVMRLMKKRRSASA